MYISTFIFPSISIYNLSIYIYLYIHIYVYIHIYAYMSKLRICMYLYMGKLGETGDAHTIDTFLGLANFAPTGQEPTLHPPPERYICICKAFCIYL